ncbi:MAG: lipid-A-disaccharide synthase, partial [Pseudomonadota bacterium]
MLVCGEPSGDALGAQLMAGLKALAGDRIAFTGVGGLAMEREGLKSLYPLDTTAVMGLREVVPAIPAILRRVKQAVDFAIQTRPDAVVVIDSPDFTHRVARTLKKRDPSIPTVDYVAPQVWASRAYRAKAMARKTGRAAEVAKAKRDQRKADANDDLAKRTGADRSATRAAEKASERNLTMTRRYGAPSAVKAVESESPIASSTSVDTSKLAARGNQAISDSRTFADAFRAARKDGNQPFTWRGKSYSTAMAGETKAKPTSRAAASSASVAPAKREPPVASKLEEIVVVGRKPPSNLEEIKRKGAALRASFT